MDVAAVQYVAGGEGERRHEALKEWRGGGGGEEETEAARTLRRRAASSPKSSLITVEGEAVITDWKRTPQFLPRLRTAS